MNSIGMATRSALVRHAERGLGVRHRPREAREIFSDINPIPQPESPWGRPSRSAEREAAVVLLAVVALSVFIVGVLAFAQYLGGAQ